MTIITETVYQSTGHHQTSSFSSCLHISQHAPLVNVWVVSLHAGMTSAAIEAPGNIDHVCGGTSEMEQKDQKCVVLVNLSEGGGTQSTRDFPEKQHDWRLWAIWHRGSLTSECCGTSEATAHIHGGDGVPNTVLVSCVVQALHGAEPRATVVASDHINSIVQRHRGDVTPFPCNVLFETYRSVLAKNTEIKNK